MDVQLWIELVPTDLKGNLAGPIRRLRGRSWVKAFASQMRTRLANVNTNTQEIGGSTVTMRTTVAFQQVMFDLQLVALPAGAGNSGRGLVVGTSTTPPAETDFDLGSRIGHGSGAGQLEYQDDVMKPLETIGGGFRISHERLFLNQSGASITINEAGIIAFSNAEPSANLFLMAHDAVSPGATVPDGSGIIVKYFEEWTV